MKNHIWNEKELLLLEEWDWVSRFIDTQIPMYISDSDIIRRTSIEAHLLILNKLVIVYDNFEDQPSEIMSFKELINLKEKREESGQEMLFHPVNFRSLLEFNYFLLHRREELFSHSN